MSGPHQPGWSDEELIALRDLRISRKALANPPQDQARGNQPRQQRSTQQRAPQQQQRSTQQRAPQQQQRSTQQRAPQHPQQQRPAQPRTTQGGQPHGGQVRTSAPAQHHEARPERSTQNRPHVAPTQPRTTPNVVMAAPVSREPESQQHSSSPIPNIRKLLPFKERANTEKLHEAICFPLRDATVGVFSRKGGVGKTTITAYLGLTLAAARNAPIVALDGDSESGSLGWLLAPRAPSTLDALAHTRPTPSTLEELSRFVTRTPAGLDLILGDTGECLPIDSPGLHAVVQSLAANYDLALFDTGSGVTHSAGRSLINDSRVLLLVMGPSVDSVRAAERTLAWLDEREDASNPPTEVIAVINGIPSNMRLPQIEQIERLFNDRCAAVVRIPWDGRLAAGTTSAELEGLAKPTQIAFQELAATTVQTLARSMPARTHGRARYA